MNDNLTNLLNNNYKERDLFFKKRIFFVLLTIIIEVIISTIVTFLIIRTVKYAPQDIIPKSFTINAIQDILLSLFSGILIVLSFTLWRLLNRYYYILQENKKYFNSIIMQLISSNLLTNLSVSEFKSLNVKLLQFYYDEVFKKIENRENMGFGGGYVIHNTKGDSQYREILEAAVRSATKSFYAVLIGNKNILDKKFPINNISNRNREENLNYYKIINNISKENNIKAIRAFIYEKDDLLKSFKKFDPEYLIKFFTVCQDNIMLFWISPEDLKKQIGGRSENIITSYSDSDFAIIDDSFIIKKDYDKQINDSDRDGKSIEKFNVEILLTHHNYIYYKLFELVNEALKNTKKNGLINNNSNRIYFETMDSDNRYFKSILTFQDDLIKHMTTNLQKRKINSFFYKQKKLIGLKKY